jgi:hypothetical protein
MEPRNDEVLDSCFRRNDNKEARFFRIGLKNKIKNYCV